MDIKYERVQFSKRLNEAIKFRGHDKKILPELGKMLGLAKSQLSNLRNGNALPSIDTGKRMSRVLNISFEWLVTGSGAMEGFQMKDADEIALMFRYRSLTQTGKRELIKAAFDEQCSNHELSQLKKTNRLDEKQTLLRLVSKD